MQWRAKDARHEHKTENELWASSRRIAMRGQYDYGGSTDRVAEQIEAHLLFALAFVTLLSVALVSLLLPWTWRRRLSSSEQRWLFGRAWDEAGTFVEFACMA
jgi:hypothetical protein